MTCPSQRRLSLPAFLAVGSLGAVPACGGDDGSTTNAETSADDADDDADDDGSSGPSTADDDADDDAASTGPSDDGSTSAASSSEDGGTTRADETSADSGSESTGGDYCFGDGSNPSCDVTEQAECEGIEICVWSEPGYCGANCAAITDRMTCCEQFECEWQFGACDYGAI